VPALWQLLSRRIFKTVAERGPLVRKAFDVVLDANRAIRDNLPYDWSLGKLLFYPIHRRLGGRMRLLISGGSALNPEILKSFRGLGFRLVEGYGMTESSPVLTVMRPDENPVFGSVGRALPGIDVKIFEPDDHGVGEVVARGPNVMKGYYQNDEATSATIIDGWLHTGDLGRLDDDGNLFIVGRKKEMILGPSGENVYPDELEDQYGDSDFVKELSIVGLPVAGGEMVAALVVPDYEFDEDLSREEVRDRVREHMRETSNKLPLYKRVKVFHLWDHDLPRTSTRKVKRREVVAELERLEKAAKSAAAGLEKSAADGAKKAAIGSADWVLDVIAQVTQKGRAAIKPELRLEELGFDSLMFTELGVALDSAGVTLPDAAELAELETVGDVEKYVERHGSKRPDKPKKRVDGDGAEDDIEVPEPLVRVGRRALRAGLRGIYERWLDTTIYGKAYVPPFGGYIVAANHASHLDTGLVKQALGETGDLMVALAAKDYFFEDPVRKMYFENFTNLVPMERHGSLRESLRIAGDVIRDGQILLIFPEGTRSETGVMIDFKPSLGYLAMHNRCGILPVYLAGTHGAMKKGQFAPRRGKEVAAHVAPFIDYDQLVSMTDGMRRSDAYKAIATHVERAVRRMAPAELEWTLGDAGRQPYAEWEASR
jgi:long-chain acyl-CoA synthetase